nr:hypothetical protein [Klebsiella pneumoniae subsp. pneumoniae]
MPGGTALARPTMPASPSPDRRPGRRSRHRASGRERGLNTLPGGAALARPTELAPACRTPGPVRRSRHRASGRGTQPELFVGRRGACPAYRACTGLLYPRPGKGAAATGQSHPT